MKNDDEGEKGTIHERNLSLMRLERLELVDYLELTELSGAISTLRKLKTLKLSECILQSLAEELDRRKKLDPVGFVGEPQARTPA